MRSTHCWATKLMHFHQLFRAPFPGLADWFGLALMSLAAPVVAVLFSLFYSCFRQYVDLDTSLWRLPYIIAFYSLLAIPTFLALLPFRRRILYRWIVWTGSTILWTGVVFYSQIVMR